MPETVTCENCGDTFEKPPCEVKDENFCDRDCYYEYSRGENHPAYNGGAVKCECDECGAEIEKLRTHYEAHDNHFCNDECHNKWQSGPEPEKPYDCPTCDRSFETDQGLRVHHGHKHDETLPPEIDTRTCRTCGDEFGFPKYQLRHRNPRFCSPECYYDYGNGGVGVEAIRRLFTPHSRSWLHVANDYREEHDACELCGDAPNGRSLAVHHIVPIRYGGTHFEENFVAVCPSCHGKAETFAEKIFSHHVWREDGGRCLKTTPPPVMAKRGNTN